MYIIHACGVYRTESLLRLVWTYFCDQNVCVRACMCVRVSTGIVNNLQVSATHYDLHEGLSPLHFFKRQKQKLKGTQAMPNLFGAHPITSFSFS